MPADTELHKAARDADKELMAELLDGGAEINALGAQGRTALHRALGISNLECVDFLMSRGADAKIIDSLKRTSLHWACMGPPPGNLDCCKLLFEKLGDDAAAMVSLQTKSGSTPLMSAASTNRHEVISLLLEKGADQAIRDDDEMTAYDLAKSAGHSAVLEFLTPQKVSSKRGGGGGGGGGGDKGGGGGDGGGGGGGCCVLQ